MNGLVIERINGTLVLTLDRPERANSVNEEMHDGRVRLKCSLRELEGHVFLAIRAVCVHRRIAAEQGRDGDGGVAKLAPRFPGSAALDRSSECDRKRRAGRQSSC